MPDIGVGQRPKGSGLETALAIWGRRKWLAIIAFAVPMVAALTLVAVLPNLYRSAATVLIDRQQIPETFVQSTVTSAVETRLQKISQDVLSRARLEAMIERFGLYRDLRARVPFEEVIERTRSDIKFELKTVETRGASRGMREATVAFTIGYQGSDPVVAAKVANTLASFYVEEDLKARERQAASTADFLKIQLDQTRQRLDEKEQEVSAFKRRHLGELPQQMETNLAALERLHTQLRSNADNQTRAGERRQALSSQLAESETLLAAPSGLPGGPAPDSAEARLARAQQELATLRMQYSEKYPDVVRAAAEVAALKRELAEAHTREREPGATRNGNESAADAPASRPPSALTPYALRVKEALSEADADLKVLKGEEKRLRDTIASYQGKVDRVPRREQEFIELSRDYESSRELYRSLLKRYEEAQLAESMEQRQKGEQFRVLDPAVPNPIPVAPGRFKLFMMGLVGSLGLAVAAVMAAERTDTSFHTLDELRGFNAALPVLASIPWIVTEAHLQRTRWRMRFAVSGAALGLVLIACATYFVVHGNERLVILLASRGGS